MSRESDEIRWTVVGAAKTETLRFFPNDLWIANASCSFSARIMATAGEK